MNANGTRGISILGLHKKFAQPRPKVTTEYSEYTGRPSRKSEILTWRSQNQRAPGNPKLEIRNSKQLSKWEIGNGKWEIEAIATLRHSQRVHCVVTAGPTYEELDEVRRLTNFSTGRLGSELATCLSNRGHRVTLLIGQQAGYRGERKAAQVETFSTTADLGVRLEKLALAGGVDAVFHAAAVSDFSFGKVWKRSESGELAEVRSGKISTREGLLLAELVPTPKLIARLRDWFPSAMLVGWKYEVDGDRQSVLGLATRQIGECRTDACVANGPAYGPGFGLVRAGGEHTFLESSHELYRALGELLG